MSIKLASQHDLQKQRQMLVRMLFPTLEMPFLTKFIECVVVVGREIKRSISGLMNILCYHMLTTFAEQIRYLLIVLLGIN